MNQREQSHKARGQVEGEAGKVETPTEKIVSTPSEEAREKTATSLSDILLRAEKAYAAYVDAQKDVATAYRESELEAERAYRESEHQAKHARDVGIRHALKARDEAVERSEILARRHWRRLSRPIRVLEDKPRRLLRIASLRPRIPMTRVSGRL